MVKIIDIIHILDNYFRKKNGNFFRIRENEPSYPAIIYIPKTSARNTKSTYNTVETVLSSGLCSFGIIFCGACGIFLHKLWYIFT